MSEPEKKPEKEEAPKAVGGGGGKLALIAILVGMLNLGATGFVGFTVMHLPPPAAGGGGEGGGHGADSGGHGSQGHGPGQLAPLETFVVNLDEAGAPRYLKAQMSVELSADPEALGAFETAKHKIRDLFLRYLSSLKVDDTRGESKKDKIRQDLLARAQEELGRDRVKDIFFGEFVVQ
jgi:flagellar protein FliL